MPGTAAKVTIVFRLVQLELRWNPYVQIGRIQLPSHINLKASTIGNLRHALRVRLLCNRTPEPL